MSKVSHLGSFAMDFNPDPLLGFLPPAKSDREHQRQAYIAAPLTALTPRERRHRNRIVQIVSETIRNYDFLGHRFRLFSPDKETPPGTYPPHTVYHKNRLAIYESDLFVLIVTEPALGLGLELQVASDATLPMLLVTRRGVPISPMCVGSAAHVNWSIQYDDPVALRDAISCQMCDLWHQLLSESNRRREHLEELHLVAEQKLAPRIFSQRVRLKLPLRELSERTNIDYRLLDAAEREHRLLTTLGVVQLTRLGQALGLGYLKFGQTDPWPSSDQAALPEDQKESMENLRKASTKINTVDENVIFSRWEQYFTDSVAADREAIRYRQEYAVVSIDDWISRLRS